MVFERALTEPVHNWNISGDLFCFQEKQEEPIIYMVKLQEVSTPVVFKFNLPQDTFAYSGGGQFYDRNTGRIVDPKDLPKPKSGAVN